MNDRTYKRLFLETRRQTMIRHNWPACNGRMTKAEREAHDQTLRELSERETKKSKRR